jgi:L,D-transpeptidase catalytic domain
MPSSPSRRDFLRLGGLSLAGVAFSRLSPGSISFDDAEIVRVATNSWSVYSTPSLQSTITSTWYRDDLIHVYKEVTAPAPTPEPEKTPTPNPNPVWYRVWGGYAWRARLQPVRTILNVPLAAIPSNASIPAGTGILAEVTVPWSSPWRYSKSEGWLQLEEPLWRLYFGSVHWVDSVQAGPPGSQFDGPWYRIWDHIASFPYYAPAVHFRPIAADEYSPLSADVPWDQKRIDVNLTQQTLTAYEYDKLVFKTTISSGIPSEKTNTHTGKFSIMEKLPSELMGEARFSQTVDGYYQLPGVPWTCYFTEDGQAFHGTYWHDNFGTPMSHGCVNMRTSEARWLFRWATPEHTADAYVNNRGHGTPVNVHL